MEEISVPAYKKGYISVGDGHELYYEACGNPHGKPILYIHGGPGAGFSESSKKYFDPKIWNIILFDQRGSGRSKPFASLEHNTTDDLVGDINTLLDFLGIEKVTLFGGSWGSTLSLIYAIRNPHKVNGMILRGIFLPSKEDNTYMYSGGIGMFAPEEWERFVSIVPKEDKKDPAPYYFEKMKHGSKEEKERFTYEWAYYEGSLMKLNMNQKDIVEDMKEFNYQSLSPLEAYYLLHLCFIPEGYILEHADRLSTIPTVIVNGKYDLICPPHMAYSLHKKIKGSTLYWTVAGHSSSEKPTKRVLLREVAKMYKKV